LDVAAEIAEALARAHTQGIVHRDLEPANVMLTEEGHAKVIDFGLAKLVAPVGGETSANTFARHAVTDPKLVMGTVSYMSPERARGGAIDHRTDIFSLGIVLYEMLAGTPPFHGPSSIETLHALLHATPAPLSALRTTLAADVTAELQRVVDKCLENDPESRPRDEGSGGRFACGAATPRLRCDRGDATGGDAEAGREAPSLGRSRWRGHRCGD
jgi:serine/threonine protein kinase